VRTQFGYHIVRRSTFPEVEEQFKQEWIKRQRTVAESTFITTMETAAKIELKPTLARTVKTVAADPDGHADDRTAVATSKLGTFTAGQVARWIMGFPSPEQVRGQIAQAPDSLMDGFVRNLLRNELILAAADSAKIQVDSTERENIYRSFAAILGNAWAGLRVAPSMIADSAKTRDERARFVRPASTATSKNRKGAARYVEILPLVQAVRRKYDWKVNAAGLERAIATATQIRAREDSAKAASMPKSQVPMPTPGADTAKQ
jgi:peptidyl-prolyl cis-trans isomerase D